MNTFDNWQFLLRSTKSLINTKQRKLRRWGVDIHVLWGPNQVFGKTEDYGFLSVKIVKTQSLAKWRNEDWRLLSPNFPHVMTEEWSSADNVKIKCEDCILKWEDAESNFGWLDPLLFFTSSNTCTLENELLAVIIAPPFHIGAWFEFFDGLGDFLHSLCQVWGSCTRGLRGTEICVRVPAGCWNLCPAPGPAPGWPSILSPGLVPG